MHLKNFKKKLILFEIISVPTEVDHSVYCVVTLHKIIKIKMLAI